MNEILAALKGAISKHGEAVVIAAALVIGGRSYLAEHDARLRADATVKAAQTQITDLEKQQAAVRQQAAAKVAVLQQKAAEVKTAPEAIQALQADTEVKAALPSLAPDPALPDHVSVEALQLFQAASKSEQDAVNLGACTQELSAQKQIDGQKDAQIKALTKKPSFWARLRGGAKDVMCAGVAGAVGASIKSPAGGAVGSMAVTAVCHLF